MLDIAEGDKLMQNGSYGAASNRYSDALGSEPDNPVALNSMCMAEYKLFATSALYDPQIVEEYCRRAPDGSQLLPLIQLHQAEALAKEIDELIGASNVPGGQRAWDGASKLLNQYRNNPDADPKRIAEFQQEISEQRSFRWEHEEKARLLADRLVCEQVTKHFISQPNSGDTWVAAGRVSSGSNSVDSWEEASLEVASQF